MENVKSSGFVEKNNAACRAFSEIYIYIYIIWKYEVLSKKNMLLDISDRYIFNHLWCGFTISSFYVQIVWKGGNFSAVKEIFLIFMLWNYMHRDVVSFRIGLGYRNQLLCKNRVKKMKDFLHCLRNFPDVNVVKLYAQWYSVILH
jgi:hypothetical protein